MKHIKLLCLMLALLMILPVLAACNKSDNQNTEDTSNEEEIEIAGIPKKSYNASFTIKDQIGYLFQSYYWSENVEDSSNISVANFKRELAIEEHLGIEIFHASYSSIGSVAQEVQQMILTGDDGTQLSLTHCFAGLVTLMSQNGALDFTTVPGVSLNSDYWNIDIMDAVKFQGHSYLGSSSLILHEPNFVLFNKEMADQYVGIGTATLYEHVRNKTWTIEQLRIYANMIDTSLNDSLVDPMTGTYGIALYKDWVLNSFVAANGYCNAYIDNDGNIQVRNFNENLFDIFKEVLELTKAESSYTWGYKQDDKALSMSTGRSLFSVVSTTTMIEEAISSKVLLGVLPVPGMKAGETIKCLDWAGYFVIPASVQNPQMSGEVAELLSYYGETSIKHEFYDVLLGVRASQSSDDQEMMDLIFDNLIVDPILPMLALGDPVSEIFYATPWMIAKGENAMRSWFQRWYEPACDLMATVNP